MTPITYTTTTPETRQIARVLAFEERLVPYIDWNKMAETARQLGSQWEVRATPEHPIVVTFFWVVTTDDVR
jgi:hypothetical protein